MSVVCATVIITITGCLCAISHTAKILEHSVDEVKFILAMGERMLSTDTSGQPASATL